jgi:hypothetical protein
VVLALLLLLLMAAGVSAGGRTARAQNWTRPPPPLAAAEGTPLPELTPTAPAQTCGPPVPHCMQGGALYGFGYGDAESKSAAACCAAAVAWRSAGARAWELETRTPAKHAPECKVYANFSVANSSRLKCTSGRLLPARVAAPSRAGGVVVESVVLVGHTNEPRLDPAAVSWAAASADDAMVLCASNKSVMQSTDGGRTFHLHVQVQSGKAVGGLHADTTAATQHVATLGNGLIGVGSTLRDSRGAGVPQGYQTAPIDGPWTTTQVGVVVADRVARNFTFSEDASASGQSHWSALPHEAVMLSLGAGDVTPLDDSGMRYLATAAVRYGHKALPGTTHRGHCCNNSVITFVTSDAGKHWRYHSTIATKQSVNMAGWVSQEGPNENSVALLSDNSTLFAVLRKDGGDGYPNHTHVPYLLAKSTDGGLHWILKEARADMLSARPRVVALSGGALIVAGGRPALNFWVSMDGGDNFETFDIPTLHNRFIPSEQGKFCPQFENATLALGWAESSGYTQALALSPDTAMICYERQGHGSGGYSGNQPKQCDPKGSSIYCMRVRVPPSSK